MQFMWLRRTSFGIFDTGGSESILFASELEAESVNLLQNFVDCLPCWMLFMSYSYFSASLMAMVF